MGPEADHPPFTGAYPAGVPTRVRAGWLATGLVAAAVAIVVVGVDVLAFLGNRSDVTRTAYPEPVGRLEVEVGSADLILTGGAGQVLVEHRRTWSFQKPEATVARDGDTLRISSPRTEPWLTEDRLPGVRRTLTLAISVPDGIVLRLRTGSGSLTLQDFRGDWRLSAGSGTVTGVGLDAATVRIESGSGDVDLQFRSAPRSVQVETSGGDVTVGVPEGPYAVRAHTDTGQLFLAVPDTPSAGRMISAQSQTGDIRVTHR